MTDKLYHPSKLFIEKRALKHPITNRIMERLLHLKPVIINDVGEFILTEKDNFTDNLVFDIRNFINQLRSITYNYKKALAIK